MAITSFQALLCLISFTNVNLSRILAIHLKIISKGSFLIGATASLHLKDCNSGMFLYAEGILDGKKTSDSWHSTIFLPDLDDRMFPLTRAKEVHPVCC